MKTLKEIQEENRKFIIMANNPEAKTYDEALEMELEMELGYEAVPIKEVLIDYKVNNLDSDYDIGYFSAMSTGREELFTRIKEGFTDLGRDSRPSRSFSFRKIIGKPLTLDRVLIALGHNWELQVKQDASPDKDINFYIFNDKNLLFWTPNQKTLKDQSEKTQREINKIIT